MIKHYFTIALRNLAKQKGLAFINIIGLSIGLACFILFLLYAVNEFSFDRFHKNAPSLYRVYFKVEGATENGPGVSPYLPMPLGPALKQDFPEVEHAVRFRENWGENFVRTETTTTRVGMSFADPEFFSVFSFPVKEGNAVTALKDLHSVVLTEATAKKLFGNAEPIGKIIQIKADEKFEPFTVTAIAKDLPSNSSLHFGMIGNFNYLASTPSGAESVNNWHRFSYQTFVQLKAGSPLPSKARFIAFYKKYNADQEEEAKKRGEGLHAWYRLQPLTSIHTDLQLGGAQVPAVDPKTIWILLSIAAGVLLIACINFTTLAIGRSAGRSKEIGVRKVIGGTRKALIFQFLAEALLLSFISFVIGFLIANLLLPFFNQLSDRTLQFSFAQYPQLVYLLAGLVALVGLLAGSYPALILSSFKPVEVLKTKIKLGGSNLFTRSLVTIQFILSAGLVISTIIILQQLHFMQSKNPGFNKENVVVVDADGMQTKKLYPLFKQELSSSPHIVSMASAELGLGEGNGWSMTGFEYNNQHKQVYEYFIDPDYIPALGLQLIAGRNFDPSIADDTVHSVIVNETMVREFGWTVQNAVGQELKGYTETLTPVVIGVVKDFNFRELKIKVAPQLFHQFASYQPYKFFVRIRPGDPSLALTAIASAWKKVAPEYPLKYSFLDENLDRFYQSEVRWSKIVGWAGGISIFLACLGLLGLTMLAIVNRTKEIGIRKVLGASVAHITTLISKDFLKLVAIALIIASPLAWYFMSKWLENFAYRISISWVVFVVSATLAIFIAFVTISIQAVKAALANPVKSLRTE
jgi:putative ABC transport system permease protein